MSALMKVMAELTDEDLKLAYFELKEFKYETGVLKNGVVRNAHRMFEKLIGSEQSLRVTEDAIFFEIAKRKYENETNNE